MDKNKSRTDLLAAGRKKLQQFRQKKDSKGSNSKSSGKAGKSGHDTSVGIATEAEAAVTQQHAADGERSAHDPKQRKTVVNLESSARVDSVASDIAAATEELSAEAAISEAESHAGAAEFSLEDSGVEQNMLNQSADDGHNVDSGSPKEGGSSTMVLEDANDNVAGAPDQMILQEKSVGSSILLPIDFSPYLERQHTEEQITDVGALQKVGSSSGNQIDKSMVVHLEGDGSFSLRGFGGTAGDNTIANSGNTLDKEEINVSSQPFKNDNTSLTAVAINDLEEVQKRQDLSMVAVPSTATLLVSTGSSVFTGQQSEGMSFGSSNNDKTDVLSASSGHGDFHTESIWPSSEFINAERFSEFRTNETAKSLGCKQVDVSPVLDGSVIKLSQLAEILQVLDEDEFTFLLMSRESSLEKFRDTDKMKAYLCVVYDAFERLKEQLYVTSCLKDTQLCENQKLIDEICAVNASLIEVEGKNEIFSKESVRCRHELQAVVLERDELQKQLHFSEVAVEDFAAKVNALQNNLEMAQGEISTLSSELVGSWNLVEYLLAENENLNENFKVVAEENKKLLDENKIILSENEKMTGELAQSKASLESLKILLRDDSRLLEEENSMVHESKKLLADLAECQSTVEALEVENKNLKEMLTCVSEERKKLEQEKMSASSEYEKQSHELADIKNVEACLQAECSKALDDLKEATIRINQLTKENDALNADLELHKCKLKEVDQNNSQLGEVENQGVENNSCSLQKFKSDWSSLEQLKLDMYDDSSAYIVLRRNLENAEMMMQRLENEIEGMHLHSTSLSSSANNVVSPGVSRLIQAFESKSHADDQDSEKPLPSENQTTEDLYTRTKMVTENLRGLLKELVNDAENACKFCSAMQSKLLTDAAGMDRMKYDYLREHTDQVEEANIELMVLYEVMRLQICHAAAKESELLKLCNALQKQELILKSENSQLSEKLNGFQGKISKLHSQLDGICRDSNEMVASISNQVQSLQAEVADRESLLEEEWNSAFAQVLQAVGELNSTVKTCANAFASEDSNLHVVGHVAASVHGAGKVIEVLHGQLEAAYRDHQEIFDKSDMALNTLQKLYNELSELVRTCGHYQDETENVVVDDNLLGLLHSDACNTLLDQLKKLFGERLQFEFENKQLNAELVYRAREIDELDKRCFKSDTILKLTEEIEHSMKLGGTGIDADEPASHLESLIYLLVKKYREAEQCLSSSKSLEMQLSSLQGQVEHLNFVLVQYQNENLVFKHSLKDAEEYVTALNSKVKEKVAELEQSEQRVSSLREKLSIAVTKGKGLISQRDSLKQSLAETSKELEKCSQELLSKDARVNELETKLKVYSEAGERMEALESELSYIRNSATALRESFLLKDSVLQRIEEILEDLELPEHFHSRNIIEKVDWLAKSVGGNSLPLGDWDRRSSAEGGSYSDAGYVGMEGFKDGMQPNPDSVDDLRRRYEDLHNKFYGLAEQNEMLEQSLLERNNLVWQWEGILDRLDVPSQLRSMEPEDKIQWLESAFTEAQKHCDSLQQKINNLETFCGSLTSNVEDSQRRASELEAAFQQVCVEKEMLSRELEILTHDNEEISKKTADLEIRNENLQSEANMCRKEKLRVEEDIHHIKDAVRRLQEFVCDALQDSCAEDMILGREGVKYLEELLIRLIEKYKTLASVMPVSIDPIDVHATEKGQLSHTSREFQEQDVETLRKKLEDSVGENMILKEERERYMRSNQSLLHEIEELEMRRKELQELLNQEELKYASLRETLSKNLEDAMCELTVLKEEKDRYIMDNQSLLCQVENLEMRKKELQQQVNQEELKSVSLGETLGKNLEDAIGELTVLKDEKDRYMMTNQSLLCQVQELKMREKELEELLNQEELNSASLRDTLSKKLEDSMRELANLKEEKDRYAMDNQSLLSEVEELEMQRKELQELLKQEELKSASLRESMGKNLEDSMSELVILKEEKDKYVMEREELQEQLNQGEMKSASVRETFSKKLEDSLGELAILKEEKDRYVMENQSLIGEVEELEMRRTELQELLNQEELKSASLRETLGKKLEDSFGELAILKEEKDSHVQNNQSLLHEIEELELKKKELQELLNQEEQKSGSLREKLNVAVRKGKSLVQQRDGMKQMIEELNTEVEHLKSETNHSKKAVSEHEEQMKNFFTTQERVVAMESENAVLRDRLEETECHLQEKLDSWSSILNTLEDIDLGPAFNSGNPVEKLEEVGKYLNDFHTQVDSLEQESRKSKRAAELLLTELNEVQERNDDLQEELANAVHKLSELSKEKDLAENAKYEALAQVEKLSNMHSEEKGRQLSELMVLKSGVDSTREDLSAIERELGDVLSKDLKILQNLKASLKSFLGWGSTYDFSALFPGSFSGVVMSRKSENQGLMTEIDSIRELLYSHSYLLQEEASQLSEVLMNVHRGYTSHKESCESLKKDVEKLELIEKEKQSESLILRGNISLLYETCASVISEIENWKGNVVGNDLDSGAPESNLKSQIPIGGNSSTNDIHIFNKEAIKSMQDKLLLVVRDFITMQHDLMEVGQKDMKSAMLALQNEVQEKDIQRDRICMELVNQIKEAETNAKNYLHELQQVRVQLHDTQRQLNVIEEERKVLEQKIKELEDQETNSKDLQQKVNSLTDQLGAKVQETEALMQALDAEETEMEDLRNKVADLENELQQKNRDLENLQTSRAKALKKLSGTVSKFDELHYLSESLLSEVEKLQSQLQERDSEISFLRQEVTRCTNDALAITELSKTKSSDEILDLLSWLDSLISRVQMHDIASDYSENQPVNEYKEVLQKKILDLISELENLRLDAQKSDILLQEERSKVEELAQKEQHLKNSLHEKESQLVMIQDTGASTTSIKSPSEIVEVEHMADKWASPGTIAPQVRSLRKTNNDQVAIAIDVDHSSEMLEDDDDKAHGFKSLTTSKFVPRFTRPVSDMVDGLWVSCDRALMRRPALRLGVIIYWAVLHALLATFVV